MKLHILVLDDERNIRQDLDKYLKMKEFEVCSAQNIPEAESIIKCQKIDIAIIDLKIDFSSDFGGIRAIEFLNKIQPQAKIIVLSAYEQDTDMRVRLSKFETHSYINKGGSQNYIKAVIEEVVRLKGVRPKKKCFVVMPFSSTQHCNEQQWADIFEFMIKPAVESCGLDYFCWRANLKIGNIIRDILDSINRADVVIADMTDRNPNVFYELGVRHALRNATVLVAQDLQDVPFDLRHFAAIQYDWTTKLGKDSFSATISKVLHEIEDDPNGKNLMSPVKEYLSI